MLAKDDWDPVVRNRELAAGMADHRSLMGILLQGWGLCGRDGDRGWVLDPCCGCDRNLLGRAIDSGTWVWWPVRVMGI